MTKINVQKGDITKIKTDAIVNAANSSLLGGGGVDGAIHSAGGLAILEECKVIRNKQGRCKTGEAVITTGGNLPAKKVIHTVGPVYGQNKEEQSTLLANCYLNSLQLAIDNNLRSIAFPNISTGVYGYPKNEAATIAVNAVRAFVNSQPNQLDEIIFVCFDEENFSFYQKLLQPQ